MALSNAEIVHIENCAPFKYKNEPIRVLHSVFQMNRAGLETMLMNYYRNIDRDILQFDFMLHREEHADYENEIEALGGRIYRMPAISINNLAAYQKALKSFFAEHPEYKVVHSHMDALSAPVLRAAKAAGVSVRIAHSHNNGFEKDKKYPARMIAKQFIPMYATDFWGCSSEALKFMFGETPVDKTEVIPNAIDLNGFGFDVQRRKEVRQQLDIEGKSVIGHIGRFTAQKNHTFLLDIFAEFLKLNAESVLLMVGEGKEKESVIKKTEQLGIAEKVIILEPRKDVASIYAAMDVFVLPSLFEGFGMVLLEAQANGLPCITSDRVSVSSSITDNVKRLSLEKTSEEWANEVKKALLTDNDRMITLAQAKVGLFGIENAAAALQKKYIDLVKCR